MSASLETLMLTGAGIVVVVGVWVDFMATALTASTTGFFSRRLCAGMHFLFETGARAFGSARWRAASGPSITLSLIISWFGMSWLGWSLIYLGSEGSVINSGTKIPAQASEVIYFVGFTLTTLGTGDFIPSDKWWELLSVIAAFNGLALVTLSITYAIPVIQAVAQKRTLASNFALWGGDVKTFLRRIDRDPSYKALTDYLKTASAGILGVAQQHLTYPILHYYHSSVSETSLPVQLAVLDEAIGNLPDEAFEKQPELFLLVPNCTRAITEFLVTLSGVFINPSDQEPPVFDSKNEHSLAADLVTRNSAIPLDRRRKLLKELIEEDGWKWHLDN